jgi:hypothetical protein
LACFALAVVLQTGCKPAKSDEVPITTKSNEARALYIQYRGTKNVHDEKSWETTILDDFADLRKAGLTNPLMDEIEKQFTAAG